MLFLVFASLESVNAKVDQPLVKEGEAKSVQVHHTGVKESSPVIFSGGPDGYGYMYYSTQDGDASVTFNWIDISTTGTAMNAGDDWCSGSDASTLYYLGFSFPFYDQTRDSISICSNGTIVLEKPYAYLGLSNVALPSTVYDTFGFVAVMWDDLNPSDASADDIYFQSFNPCPDGYSGACAVVQYHNVPRYGNTTLMDFEVILYDNGDIKLQYNSNIYYNDATIGIQDSTAATGVNADWYLQYVYNGTPSGHIPDSATAILFKYPVPADHDIAVTGIIFPQLDLYTFYPSGQGPTWPQTGDVSVIIRNMGLNDESGFDLTLDVNGNVSTQTGLSLTSGSVDTITFTGISLTEIDSAVAYHNLSTDENTANDTLRAVMDYSEMYSVGDTVTYADTLDAPSAIGSTGNLGATRIAIKFDSTDLFPFSGMYIKAIFFYHCWEGATSGCISGGNNAVAIYPDAGGVPDHTTPLFRKEIGDIGTTPGLIFVSIDSVSADDTLALKIGNFPFYVARELQSVNAGYPLGIDNGPCVYGKGCWISADAVNGGAWALLPDLSSTLDYNWVLGIVATTTPDYVGADEAIIVPGDVKLVRMVKDGYLILNAPAERDMEIYIYNTAGKLVRDVKVKKGLARVPIGRLPSGAYFYITKKGKAGSFIVR